MTLVEMIRKREIRGVATAIFATTATCVTEAHPPSVSIAKDTTAEARPIPGPDGTESLPAAPSPALHDFASDQTNRTSEPLSLSESIPAVLGPHPIPDSYCPQCGEGFWIRSTFASLYQCGHCLPLPYHCESVSVLGPPIKAGWLVAYRDCMGKLCGGTDDRQRGTVSLCQREAGSWTVVLTDGQRLPLSAIRAVTATYPDGRIRGCWEVRKHGYDGDGPVSHR